MKRSNGAAAAVVAVTMAWFMAAAAALSVDDVAKAVPVANTAWLQFSSLIDAHKGDSKAAIVTLKSYFAQFGYIPAASNFSMDFDEALESAVRLYQQNFHLKVTGSLDIATIAQMLKPRCGREDVFNGVSQMTNGSSGGSSSSSRLHAVQHYAFFPGTPKWRSKKSLSYAFDGNLASGAAAGGGGGGAEQVRDAFRNGFAHWAAVVPLTFQELQDATRADIVIEFASGAHGDQHSFDGPLGILAHAFSPEDGRFHLDADEHWALDLKSDSSRLAVHLESVATHEIGHLIGLGHSGVADAIMFPSISAREIKTNLNQDDVDGAQLLYGANPNYQPGTPGLDGVDATLNSASIARTPPTLRRLAALVAAAMFFLLII